MTVTLNLAHIVFRQSGHTLLDGIDFTVARGQIVGLLGINGAGKSTTLKIAAGILQPSQGHVITPPLASVGYVPEQPPLIPHWTVKRFLQHACALHDLPARTHAAAIARVSEQCELSKLLSQTCATLSKGNQQRVALAQALLPQPDILLLDEPTAGLDPRQMRLFRQLLQSLKSQTAIVFSTHILQEVSVLCDNVVIIRAGRQVAMLPVAGQKQQLLIQFTTPLASSVFADCPAWQSGDGKQHCFRLSNNANTNNVLAYCLQKQLPIERVLGAEQQLEDEFLAHIGQVA